MTKNHSPLLEAALGYARMGIPVFPCAPGRKNPITENGFHAASTDEAVIRQWWTDNPRANIGMPTGAVSGIVVVDIDPRHGGHVSLDVLIEEHGDLPDTPESDTSGGGRHFYYQHPGRYVPCSQGVIAPGVDVKGDGGYVMLPPSIHPDEKTYTWELSSVLGEVSPVLPPEWLLAKLGQSDAHSQQGPTCGNGGENNIPEGQRNNALASLAGGMRRNGMSRDEILAALLVTNSNRCDPPLSEKEVQRIADSVSRYQPDAVSVALVENQYEQQFGQANAPPSQQIDDPGPIPEALLRVPGFIGEVMDYTLATAPYPNPVMAFAGALSLQAFLAGRKVRDSGDNRTNIYLLGLAHSASGKDWPRKVNTRIAHEAGLANCLGERFASGEGMQDALFQTPSMLFQTDEIDGMLQSINKAKDARHEAIMSTLLTMYSSANSVYPMRRKAGKEAPGVINQPSLVIFGTAIPNHYYEALSERMLTNGFFARMIILEAGSRGTGQEPCIRDLPSRVLDTAQWWADYRPGRGNLEDWHPVPTVVEHSDDARHLLVDTRLEAELKYAEAESLGDSVGTTVWGRVSEQIRKLALLYAISENHQSPHIGLSAVEWASSFVMHQTRRMLFMASSHVADNPFHAECLKVMDKLRDAPGCELPHSVLLKRMKMDAKTFGSLIETLAQQGDIEIVTVPRAGSSHRSYRLRWAVNPQGETSVGGET